MYRGAMLPGNGELFSFSGGMASARPGTKLGINQALLVRNVYSPPGGGLKKRLGNTAFNSTAMNSGVAVQGLGYYKQDAGTEYLLAIAGAVLYKSDSLDGTMDDITGALTIGAGQNKIWDIFTFENNVIGVGGAPDAPWTWTGTGNAAALGGSPPSGSFGFQVNNRIFIGGATATPSRIDWSVLADATDWSGTGSGSQDVWTSDNDGLVSYAILNADIVLLFKQNSIHQMIVRRAPFPVFPLFHGIGAAGKHAVVVVNGLVYFITSKGRMAVTDGVRVYGLETLPNLDAVDDQWDGANAARLQYIQGTYYQGKDFEHIVWSFSDGSNTTNGRALVWDVRNKCWWNHSSGFGSNCYAKTQAGVLYMGAYDGKIYKMDVTNTYNDASETAPGAIDGFWRWGWKTPGDLFQSVKPFKLNTAMESQNSGNLEISYGFDFAAEQKTKSVSMTAPGGVWDDAVWDVDVWGGQSDIVKGVFLRGRGNAFNVSFRNYEAGIGFNIHGFTLSGKKSAQKTFSTATT